MIARDTHTNDTSDNDAGDESNRELLSRFARRSLLLPLGINANGLDDRQKESQRSVDEGVHGRRAVGEEYQRGWGSILLRWSVYMSHTNDTAHGTDRTPMSWSGRSNTCPYLKFLGSRCLQIGGLSFVEKPLGGFSIRVQGYGPSAGRHLIRKPSQKLWLSLAPGKRDLWE